MPPYTNGNPRSSGANTAANRTSWSSNAGSRGSLREKNGESQPSRFPHITDLHARAKAELGVSVNTSLPVLINRAAECSNKAQTDISFKRPDRAYIEWLVCTDILSNIIPRNRDYPEMNRRRGDLHAKYKELYTKNNAQHTMFQEIHDIIVEDNAKSGIKASSSGRSPESITSRSEDQEYRHFSSRPHSMADSPGVYGTYDSNEFQTDARTSHRYDQDFAHQPPTVHSKPARLNGVGMANVNSLSNSGDRLTERFAQLRMHNSSSQTTLPYPTTGLMAEMPSPKAFQSKAVNGGLYAKSVTTPALDYQDSISAGPRPMLPPTGVPSLPPKLPLDTRFATSLPRAPSPTYSPARNVQSQSPSTSTGRTTLGALSRSMRYPPSPPPYVSLSDGDLGSVSGYNRYAPVANSKSRFPSLPNATAISAQELYDRLRQYDILLIDVRSRQEYDDGHIFAKSIMCIEPLSLRHGMAAEDLEESLVLSPDPEVLFFQQINEFDLVVYYDQSTSSNEFLEGHPTNAKSPALRTLHDILYEFNYDRELPRRPAVLLGGLDAWTDLVGPQALQASRTMAFSDGTRVRKSARGSGRPIGRVPTTNTNSSREIRRRRLRDYNPLNANEEKEWLEKARKEEVEPAEYQQTQSDGDTESVTSNNEESVSPLIHSYEDFLRRFPDAPTIQQSMTDSRLGLPSRPTPMLPQIPSRPPPAVPRPSYSGVSDRDSSQISPMARQSASAQPLYTSRSIIHSLKLPRTGLINFSVTCYMNATIQCLLATIPLSQFFLDNKWRNFTQKNWKGSNGIMPEIYANLIRSLWKNDVQAIRPTSLRNFCTRLNREWGIDRQQDAKEFFDFLIDCLHEDLNTNWERNPLQPLTTEQEFWRESMPVNIVSKTEWDRYSHREYSYISEVFAGQHASRLRCKTCDNTSTTYEAFYSISVEIPRSGRGDIKECLKSYCKEEMLSGDEVWKCPYCRCEREATKCITITRLPKVLVVHFKRFSASKTESARKVHTPIEFPLYGLNMAPYMADTILDRASEKEGVADPAITPPFQYDAYAVMRHLGQTGNGGHYIALVRDVARGCWRKFDDEKATDFDPNKLSASRRLQNEQAYIVFYGRSAAR